MIYPFHLENAFGNLPFIQAPGGFSDEEIAQIRSIGDALETTTVKLYGAFDDADVKATGAHFRLTEQTRWIYKRMAQAVHAINRDNYRYELSGFAENFYHLTYRTGDHFNWHVDQGEETPAPRKLSLSLALSAPDEYEGGELDVMIDAHHGTVGKGKGVITAFPSHKIHRVRPVTTGIRRVLTAFASGPSFR